MSEHDDRVTVAMNEDAVKACAHLVDRSGASGFEIGYVHDDVPSEDAGWYATAFYLGARVTVDGHRSPSIAAQALSERLLWRATCRCRRPVTLQGDDDDGCRWRLMGDRWEPGCDVPAISVDGPRGDVAAMARAFDESGRPAPSHPRRSSANAERRKRKGKGRGRA